MLQSVALVYAMEVYWLSEAILPLIFNIGKRWKTHLLLGLGCYGVPFTFTIWKRVVSFTDQPPL